MNSIITYKEESLHYPFSDFDVHFIDQRDYASPIYEEQAVSVHPKHKLAPLKTPLDCFRVTQITPLPATSCHDCANPLFDAQCPFTLHPKPSINIKNSIDNGSIDFSERGV